MATLTIQPCSIDNYLQNYYVDNNNGSSAMLSVAQRFSPNQCQRPIIRFDLSGIPPGAIVNTATLFLYYYNYYVNGSYGEPPTGKTIYAYKLTRTDWEELTSCWNRYKTGSNWTTAGGDFVTSNPSGAAKVVPGSFGWMDWDVKAILEDAISHSIDLNMLLKFPNDNTVSGFPGAAAYFYSRHYPTDTSLCPKLVIDYTPIATDIPTVSTQNVTDIEDETAVGHGTIDNNGNLNITAHGVCWNTTGNPTTADSHTDEGAGGIGSFQSTMTALVPGERYYVRAYATNAIGTGYGAQVSFRAGAGSFYPYDEMTRISGIIRIFLSGLGEASEYQATFNMGGITSAKDAVAGSVSSGAAAIKDVSAYTYVKFVEWLTKTGPQMIQQLFGHVPTYDEWLSWNAK